MRVLDCFRETGRITVATVRPVVCFPPSLTLRIQPETSSEPRNLPYRELT